jgi:hypothetical protein
MTPAQNHFEVFLHEKAISVMEFHLNGQTLFQVKVPGEPPLTIMRANHIEGYKFWTSVPEGRLRLAEKIGPLIEQHFRANP